MLSIFWDSQGLLMTDYLEQGRTINGAYDAGQLRRLRQEITRKRRGKLTCGVLLLHDNVQSEIQWTSFFFFEMSLMISIWTEILHMHIIYHRLIYNCMFGHLRLENKSGISCKIK